VRPAARRSQQGTRDPSPEEQHWLTPACFVRNAKPGLRELHLPGSKRSHPGAEGSPQQQEVLERKTEVVWDAAGAAPHTVGPGHAVLAQRTRDEAPVPAVSCRAQPPGQGRSRSHCSLQEEKEAKTAPSAVDNAPQSPSSS